MVTGDYDHGKKRAVGGSTWSDLFEIVAFDEKVIARRDRKPQPDSVTSIPCFLLFRSYLLTGELQVSYIAANSGLIVYKSVPYGPLDEVIPYLSRRAAENRVVLAGARKEEKLLRAELKRRMRNPLAIAA